ncbi:hypothetical protein CEUSTIGMA_g4163.t1 [Chlamydomonas eustigma]|uniref:SAM dependent carboxyl methyltransferase n=1 Tax=Chlamydomonas eustigma TaxID=1157962 RepID=A0A250X0W5_9CHLO|nr:hypothetical protein CEUSTIGMA_g4163.t1 [Chlamydomonas eustigma]|eukprot:GAX76717.1 hypothetical protein CEUSTIGMA_g4163.t1 [Chlamydomonas eustigma]
MSSEIMTADGILSTLAPTMKQGGFYNENSTLQGQTVSTGVPMVQSMALAVMKTIGLEEDLINIADLGCSQGANSMRVIQAIVRAVTEHSRESNIPTTVNTSSRPLSLMVFHEDLPSQDWQSLFLQVEKKDGSSYLNLPGCQKKRDESQTTQQAVKNYVPNVFSAAIGRSFYERMFPDRFLHMAVSFTALHWISRCPDAYPGASWYHNRNSPDEVQKAWAAQFYADFENFLRLRASEMKEGGYMFISLPGTPSPDAELNRKNFVRDDLDAAVLSMLDDGLMTQEYARSINLPTYLPTESELQKVFNSVADVWEPSGFSSSPEATTVYISCWDDFVKGSLTAEQLGQQYEDFWRAVSESWMTGQLQQTHGLSLEAATEILNEMYSRIKRNVTSNPRQSFALNFMGTLKRRTPSLSSTIV